MRVGNGSTLLSAQQVGRRLDTVLVTTICGMTWDNVQLNEVDAIAQYIIARLGAGTAKERRKLEKLKAQKKHTHKKTKQRLDEK